MHWSWALVEKIPWFQLFNFQRNLENDEHSVQQQSFHFSERAFHLNFSTKWQWPFSRSSWVERSRSLGVRRRHQVCQSQFCSIKSKFWRSKVSFWKNIQYVMELFRSRRWRLDRPKQKAVGFMLNRKN